MPFWDERVEAMSASYPEVEVDKFHIDILTAHFVQRPDFFDVVVASNLFRRHPQRPRSGLHWNHRDRAERQPESRWRVSVAVRAGPRVGARHRRPRNCQPRSARSGAER